MVDAAVEHVLEASVRPKTVVTVVSTNPVIESFVIDEPETTGGIAQRIYMRVDSGSEHENMGAESDSEAKKMRAEIDSEAEDGFDIRSDVASAADSGDRDI